VKENEGHGFHNEENRFSFYEAMEQFLAKHLGEGGRQNSEDRRQTSGAEAMTQ
jgi:hypothetical protein